MKPYFSTSDRVERLRASARAWKGTPFALGASIRGAGVDCVRFVAEVLTECGHLSGYQFPTYTIDGGDHLERSLVEEWLSDRSDFRLIRWGEGFHNLLADGDVLEFQIGKGVAHHVGIVTVAERMDLWSAMGSDGVQLRTLRDKTWGRRLVRAWRPIES